MSDYHGSWPGPNPLKDMAVAFVLGVIGAAAWKKWQVNDKANRVEYYALYEQHKRREAAKAASEE